MRQTVPNPLQSPLSKGDDGAWPGEKLGFSGLPPGSVGGNSTGLGILAVAYPWRNQWDLVGWFMLRHSRVLDRLSEIGVEPRRWISSVRSRVRTSA
jgi:hypothetical protein